MPSKLSNYHIRCEIDRGDIVTTSDCLIPAESVGEAKAKFGEQVTVLLALYPGVLSIKFCKKLNF